MRYLFVLAFLLCSTVAQADDLHFTWTANTDTIDGYRMYMDTSDNVILDNIGIAQTTAEITLAADGQCHNFWLRAYRGDLESLNSDIAVWCPNSSDPPPATQPIPVGGFTVTVTVTPN